VTGPQNLYSGPATGIYYQEFLKEFDGEIDSLLKK
jgi:hypothetical protein